LAVYFLLHSPARFRVWPLASILPFGARTFLQALARPAAIQPASRGRPNLAKGPGQGNKAQGFGLVYHVFAAQM